MPAGGPGIGISLDRSRQQAAWQFEPLGLIVGDHRAERLRLGSTLSALSREAGLTNADFEALEQARDKTPATPMSFE